MKTLIEKIDSLFEEMGDTLKKENSKKVIKQLDRPGVVHFKFTVGDTPFKVKFASTFNKNYYEVVFYDLDEYRKDNKKGYELTGKGNASAVFASVLQAIKRFINERKAQKPIIMFGADESGKNRPKLYSRFVSQSSRFIDGYEGMKIPDFEMFVLYPKDKKEEVIKELENLS